jgi:hypothetical protein
MFLDLGRFILGHFAVGIFWGLGCIVLGCFAVGTSWSWDLLSLEVLRMGRFDLERLAGVPKTIKDNRIDITYIYVCAESLWKIFKIICQSFVFLVCLTKVIFCEGSTDIELIYSIFFSGFMLWRTQCTAEKGNDRVVHRRAAVVFWPYRFLLISVHQGYICRVLRIRYATSSTQNCAPTSSFFRF